MEKQDEKSIGKDHSILKNIGEICFDICHNFCCIWGFYHIYSEQHNKLVSLTQLEPKFTSLAPQGNHTVENNNLVIQGTTGFINSGNGTAYNVEFRQCYALAKTPQNITQLMDFSIYGSIDEYGNRTLPFTITLTGNTEMGNTTPLLYLYSAILYSDNPSNSKSSTDESLLAFPAIQGRTSMGNFTDLSPSEGTTFMQAVGNFTWRPEQN